MRLSIASVLGLKDSWWNCGSTFHLALDRRNIGSTRLSIPVQFSDLLEPVYFLLKLTTHVDAANFVGLGRRLFAHHHTPPHFDIASLKSTSPHCRPINSPIRNPVRAAQSRIGYRLTRLRPHAVRR